jgi:anti-sigma-K factor RskA
MMNLPNSDDLHLLAGPYVVNAVDDIDRRRFEQHLATCETCQDDVASLRQAVEGLGFAAAEPAPPSMKSNVMAEIDGVRQQSPVQLRTVRRSRYSRLGAAAAVVVALGTGGFVVGQRSRTDTVDTAAAIVRAPDMRMVELAGEGMSARFTYSRSVGSGVLVTNGLESAGTDRTYQLWIVEGGTPRSVGTFSPTSDGATVPLASPPTAGAVVAVTNEPAGGSSQPTSTPILAGDVA